MNTDTQTDTNITNNDISMFNIFIRTKIIFQRKTFEQSLTKIKNKININKQLINNKTNELLIINNIINNNKIILLNNNNLLNNELNKQLIIEK